MCGKHCPSLYMREKTVMKKMMKFCLFLCCILFISLPVQARTQGNLHALVMSGRILSKTIPASPVNAPATMYA